MNFCFVEPEQVWQARHASGPQAASAPLRGVKHPRAPVVMAAMPRTGTVGLWSLINRLTAETKPTDYGDRLWVRLSFWGAVSALLKVKLLYRHRGLISMQPIAYTPKAPRQRSVRADQGKTYHSNGEAPLASLTATSTQLLGNEQVQANLPPTAPGANTESAITTATAIQSAAQSLARLPRPRKRKLTGFVDGRRRRRGFPAIAPDGRKCEVVLVRRGVAYAAHWNSGDPRTVFRLYPLSALRIVKNADAVALGRRKLGIRERPSVAKAAAARANGAMPVRPGSRPRGRPRKAGVVGAGSAAKPVTAAPTMSGTHH